MGEARLIRAGVGAALLLLPGAGPAAAAGPSRFASYGTEADCVAARTFPAVACRTAFANARSEYEAKTPAFPTQAQCARRYPSCMAWPPGAGARGASFRPAWDGVDIVDTPTERSVTPAPGSTGRTVRFAARSLDPEPAPLVIRRGGVPVPAPRHGAALAFAHPGRPSLAPSFAGGPARELPPSPPPQPGSGFKLEDGVLTYPAPARFQPQNLPKPR